MIKFPAETLIRLCHISREIRLENGIMIATDRKFMAAEAIAPFEGIYHISVTPELLKQCETEARFSGMVEIVGENALRYIVAKTTLGFTTPNIGVWPESDHYIHRWRSIFEQCAEPLASSGSNMVWNADAIQLMARASPSGIITFEMCFDPINRPVLVRDAQTYEWVGCFMGRLQDGLHYPVASLPSWIKPV